MDELQRITTGVMGLVVCDIFYHICPSKVRAYNNSKGDCCKFASQFFYVVLLLVCGYKGMGNSAARIIMILVDINLLSYFIQ